MPNPGDIVRHAGEEKVIVDIDGDDMAVLRDRDDLTGDALLSAPAAELDVIGHLEDPS